MYQVFNDFLRAPTWHKRRPEDEERFFIALDAIKERSGFNPDLMGAYFDRQRPALAPLTDEAYQKARDYYVAAAWAVIRYLRAVRVKA